MGKIQQFQPERIATRIHNMTVELRATVAAWGSLPEMARRDLAWTASDIEAACVKLEAAERVLDKLTESEAIKKTRELCKD